jgi:hypothetical protein
LQEFRSYRMKRRHIPASILQFSNTPILQFSSTSTPISGIIRKPGARSSRKRKRSFFFNSATPELLQLLNSCP